MKEFLVESNGVKNGKFADKHGKRGEKNYFNMAVVSPHLKFINAPEGTVSFVIIMEDKDAFPVCGFSYIHWTAANVTRDELQEDESRHADFVQGVNSWFRNHPAEDCACYGGMAPPDAPHLYEVHVYAMDCMLDVENGFLYNDLCKKMKGHILAKATLAAIYDN